MVHWMVCKCSAIMTWMSRARSFVEWNIKTIRRGENLFLDETFARCLFSIKNTSLWSVFRAGFGSMIYMQTAAGRRTNFWKRFQIAIKFYFYYSRTNLVSIVAWRGTQAWKCQRMQWCHRRRRWQEEFLLVIVEWNYGFCSEFRSTECVSDGNVCGFIMFRSHWKSHHRDEEREAKKCNFRWRRWKKRMKVFIFMFLLILVVMVTGSAGKC